MTRRRPKFSAARDRAPLTATLEIPRYSQSLERGLAILAFFTPDQRDLRLADIADGLGLSRSTTHRYAATLERRFIWPDRLPDMLGELRQFYRLGLSAKQLSLLLGVSEQSVYNWEAKKTTPRKEQLAAIIGMRDLGKREAQLRLDALKAPRRAKQGKRAK